MKNISQNICAACNGNSFEYFSRQIKRKLEKKSFVDNADLYQCAECGTICELPVKKLDIKKGGGWYYDQIRTTEEDKSSMMHHISLGQIPFYKALETVLKEKYSKYKKWIDVGSCGFATTFKDFDFTTVEPDKSMTVLAKELFKNDKIICSDIFNFTTNEKFDAILFNNSFYCIPQTIELLEKISSLLNKDGIIMVGISHAFMNSGVMPSSIDDILINETHKVFYSQESLEYLFHQNDYLLIDNFILNHNVLVDGNNIRYLVFKKDVKNSNSNNKEYLKKQSVESFNFVLNKYKTDFFTNVKKNLGKFNNNETILIGDPQLFFKVNKNFSLNNIKCFIPYKSNTTNVKIGKIEIQDIKSLNKISFSKVVILDFKKYKEILEYLGQTLTSTKEVYSPTINLASNNLYYEIKLNNYISNSFDFKLFNPYEIDKEINSYLGDKRSVAIFGTARIGKEIYNLCNLFNLNIVCFIDDYKKGFFIDSNIPIVSRELFELKYKSKIGIILKGAFQNGLNEDILSGVKVLEIKPS